MSIEDRLSKASRHPLRQILIGFAAICAWPALNAIAYNPPSPQGLELSNVLLLAGLSGLLWLVGMATAFVPRLVSAHWRVDRVLTLWVAVVFGLFSHQSFRQGVIVQFGLGGVAPSLSYLVLFGGLVVAAWRWSSHGSLRLVLSISAILILVQAGVDASRTLVGPRPALAGELIGDVAGLDELPDRLSENVYFIILDEYGGAKALQKYLHFDITPFIEQMQALGYSHLESARSNYVSTNLSLTSTLEMDYVVDEASPKYSDRRRLFPQAFQQGWSPRVMKAVASAGADFVYVGSHYLPCGRWAGVICVEEADPNYRYASAVRQFFAPTDIPHALTMMRTSGYYGSLAPLAAAIGNLAHWPRPFFAVAHVISPHVPYHRADCSRYWRGDSGPDQYKSSIECVNRAVVALATRIAATDPEAIVVFQADHGSGFNVDWKLPLSQWTDAAIDERTSILSLIRLPELCREWLRPNLSPANTMRLVSGCLARVRPTYLEDRSFVSTNSESSVDFGIVREVTDRLRGLQK